jgi:coenzyme PQQ synthesis protein D (PqqD)
VNSPQVISETVGGETIIVNLATGHYFNLQGTAVDIWDGVGRDEPTEAIAAGLAGRYAAADGEIEGAIERFLAELAEAELVVPEEDHAAAPVVLAAPADGRELPPFTQPTFATFTDMQDIILLDPVHEVDARGWPHAPAGA